MLKTYHIRVGVGGIVQHGDVKLKIMWGKKRGKKNDSLPTTYSGAFDCWPTPVPSVVVDVVGGCLTVSICGCGILGKDDDDD